MSSVFPWVWAIWLHEHSFYLIRAGLGKHSFQKNATFLRFFAFFSKERNVLPFFCVLYKKNAAFFAFFDILYKRTLHSLRSFTFFIKECKRTLHSFWFHKSYKNYKSCKKRTQRSFYKVNKELNVQYILLYISIYVQYIYISIYIYIEKKNKGWVCVLFKRTLHSLRSFTCFAKEHCVLCVLLRS